MTKKVNIIIADDNKHFIEGLKVSFRKYKEFVVIDECHNGKELSESPQLIKADLILSDIDMPVMNGIDAAKLINFNYPKLPMIAITMYIDQVYLVDFLMAGFKGFIYKPDVAKNLIGVINKVLNNKFVFPDNLKIKKY